MSALEMLSGQVPKPVVAIVGGAVAGSEAARACAARGAIPIVIEQGRKPYGKIEDGLPRWHEKLRDKEYAKIDSNLQSDEVIFVPATAVGGDLPWTELYQEFGLSAIVLANGAWRDRSLPLDGANDYVDRGLVYQNPFVYWFNHKHEDGYDGPTFDVPDGAIVIGGGLASIDVVKIINLELYARALAERGIDVDVTQMEIKGIPRTLEAHGLSPEELGIEGCTLYYRRAKEDMPLASADNPTPEQLQKLRAARVKIMDRVMRKYLVKFESNSRPAGLVVEGDRLVGLKFDRTEIVDGRVKGLPDTEFEVRAPMIVSSIGSVPKPIEGVPTKGELYHFSNWDTGELHELPGVFGLGNVLTGKGNIKDSRKNAIEIIEKVVAAYLGVGDAPPDVDNGEHPEVERVANAASAGTPMTPEAMKHLAAWIDARHKAIGYKSYEDWMSKQR